MSGAPGLDWETDLAKDTGNGLQPGDVRSAQSHGDGPLILWEEMGRGGSAEREVDEQNEGRSSDPKEASALQRDRVRGDNLPTEARTSLSSAFY